MQFRRSSNIQRPQFRGRRRALNPGDRPENRCSVSVIVTAREPAPRVYLDEVFCLVLSFISGNWEIVERRITAKTGAVCDVGSLRSARASSGFGRRAVAATDWRGIFGCASGELCNGERSRAALPGRSGGLARSSEPNLLLPRSAAVRSHKGWGLRLPERGEGSRDAGCSRVAMSP